jgi:hypothetical protein
MAVPGVELKKDVFNVLPIHTRNPGIMLLSETVPRKWRVLLSEIKPYGLLSNTLLQQIIHNCENVRRIAGFPFDPN